ncbi:GNAT superfamily N-acetyltransferase [Sphingomonas sp. UYAg733]
MALLLELCAEIFPGFDQEYLASRLPRATEPDLWLAYDAAGIVGFKLGYRRGASLFYSWLGGVHPRARRAGVAEALMERQHARALASGYTHIETRTRAANNGMIILNLRHGFHVAAFEIDASGIPVVTQRKDLRAG